MSTTRTYVVEDENGKERLVHTSSAAKALAHSYPKYTVRVADTADVERLMESGVKVERPKAAAADPAAEPAQ